MSTRLAAFILCVALAGHTPMVAQGSPASLNLIEVGFLACIKSSAGDVQRSAGILECELSMLGMPDRERYRGIIRSFGSEPGFAERTITHWRVLAPRHQDVSNGALEGPYAGEAAVLPQDRGFRSYLIGGTATMIVLLPAGRHIGHDLEVGDVVAELQLVWISVSVKPAHRSG